MDIFSPFHPLNPINWESESNHKEYEQKVSVDSKPNKLCKHYSTSEILMPVFTILGLLLFAFITNKIIQHDLRIR